MEFPAALLGRMQQREGGVLLRVDPVNRIHDDAKIYCHDSSFSNK